jgi:hypothetical protein
MDCLRLVTLWREGEVRDVPMAAPMTGLYLQGCQFDGVSIQENKANDPGLSSAPLCYLAWIPEGPAALGKLSLPLYASPSRERLVTYLQLPCPDSGTKWMLNSAALFLSTT